MSEPLTLSLVQLDFPEDCNVIVGQSHFIKTVEDLYEILVTSSPTLRFGIAFCEASGDCLIRRDGNDAELTATAVANAERIAAGHSFIVLLRGGYPISVLNSIKSCQEVCRIFAATANPIQVIIAESGQGRGIAGVIDGFPPKGVETDEQVRDRMNLLRSIIGYKR
ncbi:MAG TPA: adenosine monophosphate-protein transferase [Synergistaceae bacterium]|nr:adenosine monophosphate-protein transferase [Synergistaceae bacterium]